MKTNNITITKNESTECSICKLKCDTHNNLMFHIKEKHNINTFEDYIVKTYYNNIHPRCQCGCSTKLKFKPLILGPCFSYYKKNHFPRNKHTEKTKQKIKNTIIKTSMKKYGYKNAYMDPKIKQKIKDTKLKKYGDCNYNNSQKNKNTQLTKFYKNLFFSNRLNNEYIPVFNVNEYTGVWKKYKFKHIKCGLEFNTTLDNGKLPICKNCYPINNNKSQYEDQLYDFIKSILPDEIIIRNDKNVLENIYELDVYLPNKKIAIEFNGLYWHSEISGKKNKNYHLGKTKFCFTKGIQLIHIFEDEWIYKNDVIKNRLKYILGISDKKIYARKCTVAEIDSKTKNTFLIETHTKGKTVSKINLGIMYENELVAVMTFNTNRLITGYKNIKNNEYELVRFSAKYRIIGGAGKLLSYFIKNYNPKKIISYADRCWSTGNLYEKIGFIFKSISPPNYWYTKNYINKFHRFNFRKNILNEKLETFDPNLTEWQNMQINGYDRIWDCGTLKYELVL